MGPVYETYELYLCDREGGRRFVAATTPSVDELMSRIREILKDERLEAVEVRQAGEHRFTVAA